MTSRNHGPPSPSPQVKKPFHFGPGSPRAMPLDDEPKRKKSKFTMGNIIFFFFLVSWISGIVKAYYELTVNDVLWPAPYNWENKIWAWFFEGMSLRDVIHPDIQHPGRDTTLDLSVFNDWL